MALGSLAVAAAALWYARHPQAVVDVKPVEVASVAGTLDSSDTVAPVADTADAAGGKFAFVDQSKPSGIEHAAASSDDKKETTVLRASNANELLDESEATDGDANDSEDDSIDEPSTLEEFVGETDLVNVPEVDSEAEFSDKTSSAVAADEAPQLDREKKDTLELDGFKDADNGLVVVRVDPQPLASEYAVTLTIRNTSDQLAVVSRVLFMPREIIENISTTLATRSFGVSSPTEMALAFSADENRAEDPDSQGRYVHELNDTFQVPADSAVDIRLAIQNPEHLGYGLRGKLTLEYNVDQSLEVENTAIAFIAEQDE